MSSPRSPTPEEIVIPAATMDVQLLRRRLMAIPRPTVVAPSAPACVRCHRKTQRFITRYSNRKGNGGRPYYKCVPCDKFACFDDERGNDDRNPRCDGCGHPSKRQVAGMNTQLPGGIHYVCSRGTCDFYEPHLKEDGEQLAIVDADILTALARLKLI